MMQVCVGDTVFFRSDDVKEGEVYKDRGNGMFVPTGEKYEVTGILVPAVVMHIDDENTVDLNIFTSKGMVFVPNVARGTDFNQWHAREDSLG